MQPIPDDEHENVSTEDLVRRIVELRESVRLLTTENTDLKTKVRDFETLVGVKNTQISGLETSNQRQGNKINDLEKELRKYTHPKFTYLVVHHDRGCRCKKYTDKKSAERGYKGIGNGYAHALVRVSPIGTNKLLKKFGNPTWVEVLRKKYKWV